MRVVARKGLDGLTYRAVAAEAGVTHGLVHYHFRTGAAMVAEALRWAASDAIVGSKIAPSSPSVDEFAAGLAELVSRERDMQAFQHEIKLAASRLPELRPDVHALYGEYFAAVEGSLIEAGLDATPPRVRLVLAALQGLVLQQLFTGSSEATNESLAELRRFLALIREEDAEVVSSEAASA